MKAGYTSFHLEERDEVEGKAGPSGCGMCGWLSVGTITLHVPGFDAEAAARARVMAEQFRAALIGIAEKIEAALVQPADTLTGEPVPQTIPAAEIPF